MKKEDIIHTIEKYAPLSAQESWDNSGVQIDSPLSQFNHLIVTLDVTVEKIKKAIALGADCIVSHHPISLEKYYLNKISPLYEIVSLALANQILIYSAHTSLDVTFHNMEVEKSSYNIDKNHDVLHQLYSKEVSSLQLSMWLAPALNLKKIEELDEKTHFGGVGVLEEGITLLELANKLEELMPPINKKDFKIITKDLKKAEQRKIKKIAFCGGSGSSFYSHAIRKQADVFITGDVKYHTALDIIQLEDMENPNLPIDYTPPILLDVGHFSLEEEMMRRFSQLLHKELDCKVLFLEGSNPFSTF